MSRVVLITGGTGKIGSQLVKHFLNKNFKVVFTAKDAADRDGFFHKIIADKISSEKLFGVDIDLCLKDSAKKICLFLNEKKLSPTDFIHCARNVEYLKTDDKGVISRENWLGELLLDVVVPYELVMAFLTEEHVKLKNIINISSMYGVVPFNPNLYNEPLFDSPINYSVAKAAQIHLTKELSIRLAKQDIKVNSISYGGVEGRVDDSFKERYSRLCPLGRMLKDEEVVGAVDFLLSDAAIGILGHNLIVDGGWSVW